MSNGVILTFVLIFIPILISKFIMEKALGRLNPEEKARLLDAFSNQRKYGGLIMIPAAIIYFLVLTNMPEYTVQAIAGFGLVFTVYYVVTRILNYRKMTAAGIPENYLKTFKTATILIALGFLSVGVQVAWLLNGSR